MRRHLRPLCFLAAVTIAVGLIVAAAGANDPGQRHVSVSVDSLTPSALVAGPDVFRAALGDDAAHVVGVAPSEQAGSVRLLLLLALALCALGRVDHPLVPRRRRGPSTRPPRLRAHQGVGLRAPPSSILV